MVKEKISGSGEFSVFDDAIDLVELAFNVS